MNVVKWVVVFVSVAVLALVTGVVSHMNDLRAIEELEVKCKLEFGENNYIVGYCAGSSGYCCVSKESQIKTIEYNPEINLTGAVS